MNLIKLSLPAFNTFHAQCYTDISLGKRLVVHYPALPHALVDFVKFQAVFWSLSMLMNCVKNVNQHYNIDLYRAAFIPACNRTLNMASKYVSGNISFIFALNHNDFQHRGKDRCDTRCSGFSSEAARLTVGVWS